MCPEMGREFSEIIDPCGVEPAVKLIKKFLTKIENNDFFKRVVMLFSVLRYYSGLLDDIVFFFKLSAMFSKYIVTGFPIISRVH